MNIRQSNATLVKRVRLSYVLLLLLLLLLLILSPLLRMSVLIWAGGRTDILIDTRT